MSTKSEKHDQIRKTWPRKRTALLAFSAWNGGASFLLGFAKRSPSELCKRFRFFRLCRITGKGNDAGALKGCEKLTSRCLNTNSLTGFRVFCKSWNDSSIEMGDVCHGPSCTTILQISRITLSITRAQGIAILQFFQCLTAFTYLGFVFQNPRIQT